MRILMTTDTVGGVWTFSRQLSWELLARGCHVALVSVGCPPSEAQMKSIDAQSARWGAQFRFAASTAPLEWMEQNDRAYSEAAPLVMAVAIDFGADLILSSQYCFGALPLDIPRIVVAHSDVLSWARACRHGRLSSSEWLDRYCKLVGEGLSRADAVVAPTHWMLHALEQGFRISGEPHVIHNGRSILPTVPSEQRRIQAVAAGRLWDEAKNLMLLTELNIAVPLLIAGDAGRYFSESQLRSGSIVLVGQLDEEDILALFRKSAIYICASKYEPFGLAPLEAALCGCAIVANDIPSLREVWDDAALFFDGSRSLSALLSWLSESDCALSAARKQARWRASHFTAGRMAESYLELFRSLVSASAERYAA